MYRHCLNRLVHLIIPREAARNFGSTSVTCRKSSGAEWKSLKFGGNWRIKQGKAMDGSTYGPLTDLPDYTYLDGRPTPLSRGQLRRREENKEMAKHVMKMMTELDLVKKPDQKEQNTADRQKKRDKSKNFKNFKSKGRQSYYSNREKRSI
ncbi:39S ribosomal protein L52, mitochondrial-like [Mizuhopecten yessoensis]|uniref:39S ribosomal protein L52, mitochondrial-like n=1 Tax=Mizuhopecten yessoensis TaxID=6573 RepID=UPI000B45A81F|nr:39S ribosomal protein L52, mitochondrial-like [Mizuhopecten yessoensis]